METQFLARWHATCAKVKNGPFPRVTVIVSKLTNNATLVFGNERGNVQAVITSRIGAEHADYEQIGQEILAVARQYSLLDHQITETSIFDGDVE
jgi:hypothetical protein